MPFCSQCGKPIPDGATICDACRELKNPKKSSRPEKKPKAPKSPKSSDGDVKSKKWLAPIIAVVIVIVVILLIVLGNLGRSSKSAMKGYFKAFSGDSVSKMLSMVPDDFIDDLLEVSDLKKSELKDAIEDRMESYRYSFDALDGTSYTLGEKIRISVEDRDKLSNRERKEMIAWFLDSDDFDKFRTSKIKAMEEWDVELNKSGDSDTYYTFKYKGEWYSLDALEFINLAVDDYT